MSNFEMTKTISILAFIGAAGLALPASAQIGGVTGSVGGTVDTTVGGTVNSTVNSRTNVRVKAPETPRVKVQTPARATVRAGSSSKAYSGTRYHGAHYHGAHYHDHGHYGYDHFHDHADSHAHGYAKVVVKVESAPQDIGPLLAYGTEVRSKKGKDLGYITVLSRTESGRITHVMADRVPNPIPVATLRAEGDVLYTSLSRKKLKR